MTQDRFTAYKIVLLVKYVHIPNLSSSRLNHQIQQVGSMRAVFLGKNVLRQAQKIQLCLDDELSIERNNPVCRPIYGLIN